MLAGVRKLLPRIVRVYAYFALVLFVSGVIGGAWLAMSGNDMKVIADLFR